jgi:hypothetical protein
MKDNFLLDKFKSKILTYKTNSLSLVARVELINYVFDSIPVYYMSNIIFSRKFLAKMTSIIRNFRWTRVDLEPSSKPLCLAAWKNIFEPKKKGMLRDSTSSGCQLWAYPFSFLRIASNPRSQLSCILQSKYFSDSSI